MPRYLNSELNIRKGSCIFGVLIAKLFKGKHSLLEKCYLYQEKVPNCLRIPTNAGTDSTGLEI